MKHGIHLPSSLLVIALLASSAWAQNSARVRHVPPSQAAPEQPLEVVASVDRGWEATLELRYRPLGTTTWQGVTFNRRDASTYVATIPAGSVAPPGLEYFIVGSDKVQTLHFASPEVPHRVNVFLDAKEVRRAQYLAHHDHRRAQLSLAGEWVDYGYRSFGERELPDRYYRIDAAVGYRVLSFPLKTLRFGYTQLIGRTPISASRGDDGSCPAGQSADQCTAEVGFKGGGWFELRFILRDGVELDTRGMVMATQTGFNVGGRGELRIGDSQGTHLGLGVEHINDVGTAGLVRLAWGTVPGLPMAATVEVTNFPAPHRDAAVRLVYDVARPFANGFTVGARVGYQARDQMVGGLTLGLNTTLEF